MSVHILAGWLVCFPGILLDPREMALEMTEGFVENSDSNSFRSASPFCSCGQYQDVKVGLYEVSAECTADTGPHVIVE